MASGTGERKQKKVYSKKIQKLRRAIVFTVVAACLIPTCICLILAVRYDRLRTKYEKSEADLNWYRDRYGDEKSILAASDSEDSGGDTSAEYGEIQWDYGVANTSAAQNPEDIEGTRYVYLTFDDGPSSSTGEILDILDQYGVQATFFVCGKPDSKYTDLYKRIVDEGHTLGMHSYSHSYKDIYASLDSFKDDFKKIKIFLYDTTDVDSVFYRFPGGSSNKVIKDDIAEYEKFLDEQGVTYFDWNVSANDDKAGATKETVYNNIVSNIPKYKHCVVLMHDAADKKYTVEALPEIIEAIQAMDDTVIVPITEDTLPVQHIKK